MKQLPKRAQRQEVGAVRVTKRDMEILSLIERAQPVTTKQVQAYLEMTAPDMARRRYASSPPTPAHPRYRPWDT